MESVKAVPSALGQKMMERKGRLSTFWEGPARACSFCLLQYIRGVHYTVLAQRRLFVCCIHSFIM
jgi:hypothetical protein